MSSQVMPVNEALFLPGMGNDPKIEEQGIIEAMQRADDHWALLISKERHHDTVLTESAEKDLKLYKCFLSNFGSTYKEWIEDTAEDAIKNIMQKGRWRSFLLAFSKQLGDQDGEHLANDLTLFRQNCRKGYTRENTFIVPYAQFLCIEIARNLEGLNDGIADAAILDDLVSRRESLEESLGRPTAATILFRLQTDYPNLTLRCVAGRVVPVVMVVVVVVVIVVLEVFVLVACSIWPAGKQTGILLRKIAATLTLLNSLARVIACITTTWRDSRLLHPFFPRVQHRVHLPSFQQGALVDKLHI